MIQQIKQLHTYMIKTRPGRAVSANSLMNLKRFKRHRNSEIIATLINCFGQILALNLMFYLC